MNFYSTFRDIEINEITKMLTIKRCIGLIIFLGGCAMSFVANSDTDSQWIGSLFNGGSAVITTNQLTPNKYYLDIKGPTGVGYDQLLPVFQTRAQKLCAPRPAVFQYKVGSWTYDSTVTTVLTEAVTAPTMTGIVTCR